VWTLPLRWLTQDLHYYYRYFRAMRLRPKAEVVEAAVTLIALHALAGAIAMAGYGTEVLLFWLIPTRLALGMLAFAFDFLPHHPHSVPASEDRFQATGVLPSRWLTPLLISQNYHLVHHLYPGVPFYRYGRVWWSRRDQLIAKGARVGFGAMRSTSLLLDSHSALE
jgi:beta-carotene hydroxylase